jgi:hypothetical protein
MYDDVTLCMMQHGRVALFTIGAYICLLAFDFCVRYRETDTYRHTKIHTPTGRQRYTYCHTEIHTRTSTPNTGMCQVHKDRHVQAQADTHTRLHACMPACAHAYSLFLSPSLPLSHCPALPLSLSLSLPLFLSLSLLRAALSLYRARVRVPRACAHAVSLALSQKSEKTCLLKSLCLCLCMLCVWRRMSVCLSVCRCMPQFHVLLLH